MLLHQLVAALEDSKSERALKASIHHYLTQYGFNAFAFTYYSGHIKTGRKLKFHLVSDALRPWHLHYLEQAYADVDRTLETIHTQTLPLYWNVHEQLKHAKNKRERRIRLESIEFGIHRGLSLPVHGPNLDFAVLTLHEFRDETCLSQFESDQYEWMNAAQMIYHYTKKMLDMSHPVEPLYQLTKREEQTLMLTAKGWRVEQIANELKISSRTVNFHIQNANKKMGTNNKYQSMCKYLYRQD